MADDMEMCMRLVMEGLRAAKTRQEVEQWLAMLQENVGQICEYYRAEVSQ